MLFPNLGEDVWFSRKNLVKVAYRAAGCSVTGEQKQFALVHGEFLKHAFDLSRLLLSIVGKVRSQYQVTNRLITTDTIIGLIPDL